MAVYHNPCEVREIVEDAFLELDVPRGDLAAIDEHLLVQDGRYYGRTYRVADLMAMWFIEIQLVQIYNADGEMLMTINLGQEVFPMRMVA